MTARTLHHYDEIGLLRPSGRSDAGYRLYAREDLERLQEILVWRQLGFSLQEIRALLDDPGHDRVAALSRQRALGRHRGVPRVSTPYGDAEWAQIQSEAERLVADFASLMRAGEPADGERAQAVADRHRQHIAQWFYPVSLQMHRNLAEMYAADQRFAAGYENVAPGLAAYVRDAVVANADARQRE